MNDTEDDSNKRVFEMQQILFDADKEMRRSGRLKRAQNLINEARHNLNFVLMGKGHHNIEYALKLLNVTNRKVEEAKSILVPGYKPHEITPIPHDCTTLCHTEIKHKTVPFGKVDFPHEPHVIGSALECLACHASREEEHGKTLMKNCKSCHHGEGMGKVGCEDCHPLAARLVQGELFGEVEATPSSMAEVVECVDCHLEVSEGKPTTGEALKQTCIDCHEEKYGALLLDWENQTAELLKTIHPGIEEVEKAIGTAERKGKNTIRARNLLKKVRDREKLVKEGSGVHNLEYSKKVIESVRKMLPEIKETID